MDRLAVGYGAHRIAQAPDEVIVRHGARVAVAGPNGSGKTTLARTVIGELPALAGTVTWAPGMRVGYYSQTAETNFTLTDTVLEAFETKHPIGSGSARDCLGRFLFAGDEVHKQVADLSGGERSRLALACLLYSPPDVLILDEPTNDLDIPSREALEGALRAVRRHSHPHFT